MKEKKPSWFSRGVYSIFLFFMKIIYRKTKVEGIEKIPGKNTIIVANHAQLNGPIIAQLHMPKNCYIWANGQMAKMSDVSSYAMEDFFPYKKRWLRPLCRLASYALAPLLVCMMNNARVIPVYHDIRLTSTMRESIKKLSEGNNILIFPEKHQQRSNVINCFREHFVDLARLYHRRTGEVLTFLPMYIAPDLKLCCVGEGICYDPCLNIEEQRHGIAEYLASQIEDMAGSLPEHTVVPFDNISRKLYPRNK